MILEGFEISNWSCIKKVVVTGLPPTGVIVFHGPNGTGKSSIVEALRACLMDNKSTSKALERGFSKNSSEKPRVTVTFRASGTSWKIVKQFNSKESKLESQTPSGQWKPETVDPSEAHDRVRQLTGGSDSSLGLHQLLWLTQAEFRLPDPKKFDTDVQSRLRAVLGVLQTPLDDQFLSRVKEGWSRWFGARSKPGEKPKLKKDCPLGKALTTLEEHKSGLSGIEREYQAYEGLGERSANLEVLRRDLQHQLRQKTRAHNLLQQEYEKSRERINARRLAAEVLDKKDKALADALALRKQRADAEQFIAEAKSQAETAGREAEDKARRLQMAEQELRTLRENIQDLRTAGREFQARINEVTERRQLLALVERLKTLQEKLKLAEETASHLHDLKKQARERPAPDDATLSRLEENRGKAGRLRAELEAAAIALSLAPEVGAVVPQISIDGAPGAETTFPTDGTPLRRSIRRRAEIAIPGWGRAEITRGSDSRSLDQIEDNLAELDRLFAEALAPFGVPAGDPTALDQARRLAAEKKLRDPELKRIEKELARLAPKGLDSLREEVAALERQLEASEYDSDSHSGDAQLPQDTADLDRLGDELKKDLDDNETKVAELEEECKRRERLIEGDPNAQFTATKKKTKAEMSDHASSGLRQQAADTKDQFTTLNATVEVHRGSLERLPTAEQIDGAVQGAEIATGEARNNLESAQLNESEETIHERLDAAKDALQAVQDQLTSVEKEFHQIEGSLRMSEGLHPKRAAAAARVEELTRQTERETLESQSYDRLYALFEECREKQLGTVMGPIQDRVMRWMRLLRIGGSIRFNDQFLPEKLVVGDGAAELLLPEESVGTIEQIALMVRLGLGSTLSTPGEPVVAVLDDPLTHSDVVRLDRMRAVLKSAAAGDAGTTPPAGPMQIVVFTCHPEWFAVDGATVVDLGNPEVLTRL